MSPVGQCPGKTSFGVRGSAATLLVNQSSRCLAVCPFHLKARIVETTNPDSDYKAEIEEYWVAPDKWLRSIQSPAFSQTLVSTETKFLSKTREDYYP